MIKELIKVASLPLEEGGNDDDDSDSDGGKVKKRIALAVNPVTDEAVLIGILDKGLNILTLWQLPHHVPILTEISPTEADAGSPEGYP